MYFSSNSRILQLGSDHVSDFNSGGLNRVRVGGGLEIGISSRGRKNEKSKERDCKADQNNVYCFFMIIFRLATPAFFKFTDVTEFMEGITILYRVENATIKITKTPLFTLDSSPGGAFGYFLGGYVPPGTPNWHPVLKKISPKIDTPF